MKVVTEECLDVVAEGGTWVKNFVARPEPHLVRLSVVVVGIVTDVKEPELDGFSDQATTNWSAVLVLPALRRRCYVAIIGLLLFIVPAVRGFYTNNCLCRVWHVGFWSSD